MYYCDFDISYIFAFVSDSKFCFFMFARISELMSFFLCIIWMHQNNIYWKRIHFVRHIAVYNICFLILIFVKYFFVEISRNISISQKETSIWDFLKVFVLMLDTNLSLCQPPISVDGKYDPFINNCNAFTIFKFMSYDLENRTKSLNSSRYCIPYLDYVIHLQASNFCFYAKAEFC